MTRRCFSCQATAADGAIFPTRKPVDQRLICVECQPAHDAAMRAIARRLVWVTGREGHRKRKERDHASSVS